MVAGALAAPSILRVVRFGSAVMLGPALSVVAAALMVATRRWPAGAMAASAFFLFGAGRILWTITSTTLRQTVTPTPMLGRVSAIFLTVNAGARPIRAALGGVVGATWNERACLFIALAGFALQAAVIAWFKVRGLAELPVPMPAQPAP